MDMTPEQEVSETFSTDGDHADAPSPEAKKKDEKTVSSFAIPGLSTYKEGVDEEKQGTAQDFEDDFFGSFNPYDFEDEPKPKEPEKLAAANKPQPRVTIDKRTPEKIVSDLRSIIKDFREEKPQDLDGLAKILRRNGEDGSLHGDENKMLHTQEGRVEVVAGLEGAVKFFEKNLDDEIEAKVRTDVMAGGLEHPGCFAARASAIFDAKLQAEHVLNIMNGEGGATIQPSDLKDAEVGLEVIDSFQVALLEKIEEKWREHAKWSKEDTTEGLNRTSRLDSDLSALRTTLKGTLLGLLQQIDRPLVWLPMAVKMGTSEAVTAEKPGKATSGMMGLAQRSLSALAAAKKKPLTAEGAIRDLGGDWDLMQSAVKSEAPELYSAVQEISRDGEGSKAASAALDHLAEFAYAPPANWTPRG